MFTQEGGGTAHIKDIKDVTKVAPVIRTAGFP